MRGMSNGISKASGGGGAIAVAAQQHRNIFRGQFLGNSLTAGQVAQITAGTFDDLFVGDYWTINGVNYRIADIDYWFRTGDTEVTNHHLVIIPDTALYDAAMNETDTTEGGYYGSAMRGGDDGISSGNLAQAETIINAAFGSAHILNKRLHLTNSVTNGRPNTGTWYDSTIDLITEVNAFGTNMFNPMSNGSTTPYIYTLDTCQFALFQLAPVFLHIRAYWWLRDVGASNQFIYINSYGMVSRGNASRANTGVRPAFALI